MEKNDLPPGRGHEETGSLVQEILANEPPFAYRGKGVTTAVPPGVFRGPSIVIRLWFR